MFELTRLARSPWSATHSPTPGSVTVPGCPSWTRHHTRSRLRPPEWRSQTPHARHARQIPVSRQSSSLRYAVKIVKGFRGLEALFLQLVITMSSRDHLVANRTSKPMQIV